MSKLKYYDGTEWKIVNGQVTGDTLPIGSEVDFDGETVPVGWQEIDNPDAYSTSEVKTNKVWVDGKPIYKKTLQGVTDGTYIENSWRFTWITAQNVNANIDTMTDISFNIKALNRQLTSTSASVSIEYLNDGRIQIGVTDALIDTSSSFKITIYYTKTTD